MKILLDQNISYKIIKKLNHLYEEITQIGRLGMAQTDDAMVWQYARTHGYMLVTYDIYFQERNAVSGHPIKIIWLRTDNTSTPHIIQLLTDHHEAIEQFYQSPEHSCLEIVSTSAE